jgi:hypothetical protein
MNFSQHPAHLECPIQVHANPKFEQLIDAVPLLRDEVVKGLGYHRGLPLHEDIAVTLKLY